jgi:hypothetical protein
MAFCRQCATALVDGCRECGADNPPGFKFCGSCGTSLTPSLATTPPATAPSAAAVPDVPSSFADGRYQVERFLGEGGKKMVYLAHDNLLDREAAFALIKTEGLDDVSRERVVREAQAMGRLGSHPHIMAIFDLGEHEGTPYKVTEIMAGGDVDRG